VQELPSEKIKEYRKEEYSGMLPNSRSMAEYITHSTHTRLYKHMQGCSYKLKKKNSAENLGKHSC
jgi:hypothetical protein